MISGMSTPRTSQDRLREHLLQAFPSRKLDVFHWDQVPLKSVFPDFDVLRLAPAAQDPAWLFVSRGASEIVLASGDRFEFLIASPEDDPVHIENLAMVASFHADPRYRLYPGRIVSIGRPWMADSNLDHLFVSLPYPYGEAFERCGVGPDLIRILWLQPIAASEARFAREHGLDALEQRFEDHEVNYLARSRPAVA